MGELQRQFRRHVSPPRAGAVLVLLAVFVAVLTVRLLAAEGPPQSGSASGAEEALVLAAVQQFFDGMATGDATLVGEVVVPEGQFFSIRYENAESFTTRTSTNQEFLDRLAAGGTDLLERMWDPTVMIHGRLATVWTPYDFHRDGDFSHCGVDSFNLVRTEEGWKIANGAYTVEPSDCAPSPLGPPRR